MTARKTLSAAALLAALSCSNVLLAAPPNDLRANAVVINLNTTVNGTTVTGTNSGDTGGACGGSGTSADVWYRFDCTSNTGVQVSTCSGGSYDTVLQAFAAGPGGTLGAQLACQDDDSSCGTLSTISFGATAGNSYYVRVAGYNGATGTFTLAVSPTVAPPPPPTRTYGPDVTVGNLYDIATYGTGNAWVATTASAGNMSGVRSYAVGTDSWNIGDVPVEWQSSNQFHPVIGQQMYRYKGGHFEQIGISWLKHGFLSTNSGAFPDMGSCDTPPSGGAQLGVNCSDLYDSGLNGGRSYLGPRFDVKPISGVYSYPWNPLVGTYSNTDVIARRLVVLDADVAPASNAGAEYYVDTCYITQDDAQWNNGKNNYSSRKLSGNVQTAPAFGTTTFRRTTALEQWAAEKIAGGDTGISISDLLFHERSMNVTDKWRHWTTGQPDAALLPSAQWTTFTSNIQGRFVVASRTSANGDGTWNYDYMVMNVNSDRAGGSFQVRLPDVAPTSIAFKAPLYHSGERTLNNTWQNNAGASGSMKWNVDSTSKSYTVPGMASSVTFNPNALMWGTMYSFQFKAPVAPTTGVARLGLFRNPTDATGFQGSSLAVEGLRVPTVCTADLGKQGGLIGPDGILDNNDFIVFIDAFFNNDMLRADMGKQGGLAGPDNMLDNNDFIVYIDAYFDGCAI